MTTGSKLSRRLALSFGGAAALAAFAPAARAQAGPVVMKVAAATINDVIHHWMKTFKAGVEGRAAGRIKVELYPASQLGAIPRMVEGAALGTIECFVTATSFLTNLDARFEIFDVPGVVSETAHAARVFADAEFRRFVFGLGNAKGLESIAAFMHSPQNVLSRKPIRKIADFNGQKIRVLSTPLQIEPLKKLGASPVPMPLSEVMPALQNGAIDGFIAASTVFSALKFYDAAKFQTELPQWPVIVAAACNRNWLGKLAPELRALVQEEAAKAEAAANEFGATDIVAAKNTWLGNGGQILALAPEEAAAFTGTVSSSAAAILQQQPAAKAAFDSYAALAGKLKT
jgi:TRAP-type transport system periplasmic protein